MSSLINQEHGKCPKKWYLQKPRAVWVFFYPVVFTTKYQPKKRPQTKVPRASISGSDGPSFRGLWAIAKLTPAA